MFFWTDERETALTEAVIRDDREAIKALSGSKAHREAVNYLGFNGVEIARYLDKQECLKILEPPPHPSHRFKVCLPSSVLKELDVPGFEQLFNVHYLVTVKFGHYSLLKKTVKSCPWLVRAGSIGEEMRQLYEDNEEQIRQGYVVDATIRWINDRLGYGLFANRAIEKGEYIGEYCGEMHPRSLLNKMHNPYCFQYPKGFPSFFFLHVDAKDAGNEVRFINHSYTPNLEPRAALDRGLVHILLFAKKRVPKGAQLTYDYGEDYWARQEPPVDL